MILGSAQESYLNEEKQNKKIKITTFGWDNGSQEYKVILQKFQLVPTT